MDISGRYIRVNEICNATARVSEEDRSKLLTIECGNDEDLRSSRTVVHRIVRSKVFWMTSGFGKRPAPSLPPFIRQDGPLHYQLFEELARAHVCCDRRADTQSRSRHRVEVLPPAAEQRPQRRRRFRQEARRRPRVNHPYIVTIHDINTTPDGFIYSRWSRWKENA